MTAAERCLPGLPLLPVAPQLQGFGEQGDFQAFPQNTNLDEHDCKMKIILYLKVKGFPLKEILKCLSSA